LNFGVSEDALCASHSAIKKKQTKEGKKLASTYQTIKKDCTGPAVDTRK